MLYRCKAYVHDSHAYRPCIVYNGLLTGPIYVHPCSTTVLRRHYDVGMHITVRYLYRQLSPSTSPSSMPGLVSWAWGVLAVYLALLLVMDADLFSSVLCAVNFRSKAFKNQVVWITGASSGIGAQLARDLAREGAQVVVSSRRAHELEQVADSCEGLRPLVVPLDVTDYSAQKVAYESIVAKFGRVDILVLNAGRTQRAFAENFALASTKELFELNFFAVINLAKMVVPDMIRRKDGQIVVTSSVAGKIGSPIQTSYSATKYALQGYFDALRAEIAQFNIGVLLVCAGPVESEIVANALLEPNAQPTSEGKKMPTARCTDLMVRAMYNKNFIQEIWISNQPVLLITYMNVYLPWLTRQLFTRLIGPGRRKAFLNGESVFDFKVHILSIGLRP